MSWFTFHPNDFAVSFLSILFEGIPFLLLGSIVSGIVDAWVPPSLVTRLLPKQPAGGILLSGLLGLAFPMCECGSVVVIRRFIRKGLPVSCAVTYMLAAPIVSPVVAISTYAAFKGQNPELMTSLRLALGYSIAVVVGMVTHRIAASTLLQPNVLRSLPGQSSRPGLTFAPAPSDDDDPGSRPRSKVAIALNSATSDFLDVAFFLVLGSAIAAVFNTSIDQQVIKPFETSNVLGTLAMMTLAFVLAVCSTSDAFIAASFVTFPFVAKLAFLLFGPLLDIKLVFLYHTVFRRRIVLGLAIGLSVTIALTCVLLAPFVP